MGGTDAGNSAAEYRLWGQDKNCLHHTPSRPRRPIMGVLDIFKRSQRAFKVVIGEQWTINGKATQHENAQDVLAEIYDIAVYFPITITVQGPEQVFQIEMDEHGDTYPLETPSETARQDERNLPHDAPHQAKDNAAPANDAVETAESTEARHNIVSSALRALLHRLNVLPRKALIAGAALSVAALIAALALPLVLGSNATNEAQAISVGQGESWQTPIPETSTANQALDKQYKKKLWSLEPGEAESASWFKAGVVTTDHNTVRLLDHHTGEQISSHELPDSINLNEDLQWVTEFYHDNEPAVGLRVADTFTAMTAGGQVQQWQVPADTEISVYGTTPVVHNGSQTADAYQALVIGKEKPVQLTVNPAMTTRAVDDDWIVQLDIGAPKVALNPVNRASEDHEPHAIALAAPTGEAKFIRHLDAGHGYALALWKVQDDLYLGVHALSGDQQGQVTTFLPAPFAEDQATGWAIGNGLEFFIIGPYAISITSGELVAFGGDLDITRAYGSAAVTEAQDQRFFIVENTKYTESERIIGYTEQGMILVRLIDGSVAAYGDYGGIA